MAWAPNGHQDYGGKMEDKNQEPASIQVNVRISPKWLEALKALAEEATNNSDTIHTAQDIIREAIQISYDHLKKKYFRYQQNWR